MQRRRGQREVAIKVGGIAEADVAVVAQIERLAFDVRDEARRRGPQDFVGRGDLARQGEGIVAPAEGAIGDGGAVEGWRGDREIDAGDRLDGVGAQVGIENGAARDAHVAEREFLQRGGRGLPGSEAGAIRDDAGIGCGLGKADFCLLRERGGKSQLLRPPASTWRLSTGSSRRTSCTSTSRFRSGMSATLAVRLLMVISGGAVMPGGADSDTFDMLTPRDG